MNRMVLTFDYELFLGRNSGTVDMSIVKPTNIILELLAQYKATGIFFVDAAYLFFLKERNHKDYNTISNHIKEIILNGNNVELHLHPQWIDAYEIEDRWSFTSYKHYRLHSLDAKDIMDMFLQGKKILEEIISEVQPGYRISAFRSGGWSITPFNKLYKAFKATEIELDFSVLPEAYMIDSDINFFDFRGAPQKPFWHFDIDPIKENVNGCFIEVPCSRISNLVLVSLLNKILTINSRFMGDGEGVHYRKEYSVILRKLFQPLNYYLTIDYTSPIIFRKNVKSALKKCNFLSIYSHPKCLSNNSKKNLIFLLQNFSTCSISDIKLILSE